MARSVARFSPLGHKLVPDREQPHLSSRRPRRQRRRAARHRPAGDAAVAPLAHAGEDVVAARRVRAPGRVARGRDAPPPRREGRGDRRRPPRAARLATAPTRTPSCGCSTSRYLALIPRGAEPDLPPDTEWHPVDDAPARRLRPRRRDRPRPRAPARQALLLQRRLRPRPAALHAARAGRRLRGGPRLRGLPDEPRPRPRPRRAHRADRRPPPRGSAGGRPAAEFAFTRRELVVSRPLAAFKPPG